MRLPPWHTVVPPREDLRRGEPIDAAEFAVHLEKVREGKAPADYQEPTRFFERTYPTVSLKNLAGEVLRRLAGQTVETSAVFNLTTQFGGGKTHALTLLYHLARSDEEARSWRGARKYLEAGGVEQGPRAATAVFVGQGFDVVYGREGRRTPWGDLAFQLGGPAAYAVVEQHDRYGVAPAVDVLERVLPADRPALILMDETMNYMARARTVRAGETGSSNLATQFYGFLQNLTEAVRGRKRAALVAALPGSDIEMAAEDEADYARLQKLLDRVGKAYLLSEGGEIPQIVKRRLFEFGELPRDAGKTVRAYAEWVRDNRDLLPGWFPPDRAEELFRNSYPLHPCVLSVFERKWQVLPRFQRTRGVLRLLALWVSQAYGEAYRGAQRDPLITLGTAPFELAAFRAALFEQLGEDRLEGAVITDIAGGKGAHAVRLDEAAGRSRSEMRLHRKVAGAVFFESNGGQAKAEATLPEVRLAVGEPGMEIGLVESALESLRDACYFLHAEGNRYRFGFRPNLNKLLSDRQGAVDQEALRRHAWETVQRAFAVPAALRGRLRVVLGPEKSGDIPDEALLTLVVVRPEEGMDEEAATLERVRRRTQEHGASHRSFKNALVWCLPAGAAELHECARRYLAWKDIEGDQRELGLDDTQRQQLERGLKRAESDLREAVWHTYRHLRLLGKDGELQGVDMGLLHSSSANSLVEMVQQQLEQQGDLVRRVGVSFLRRNWPASPWWSTRRLVDSFFAAPRFPRLLNADDAVREAVADGVAEGELAYAAGPEEKDARIWFREAMSTAEVEIAEDTFVLTPEEAQRHLESAGTGAESVAGESEEPWPVSATGGGGPTPMRPTSDTGWLDPGNREGRVSVLAWRGVVPHQKWNLFYRQVLSPLVQQGTLRLQVILEAENPEGYADAVRASVRQALRETTEGGQLEEK